MILNYNDTIHNLIIMYVDLSARYNLDVALMKQFAAFTMNTSSHQ